MVREYCPKTCGDCKVGETLTGSRMGKASKAPTRKAKAKPLSLLERMRDRLHGKGSSASRPEDVAKNNPNKKAKTVAPSTPAPSAAPSEAKICHLKNGTAVDYGWRGKDAEPNDCNMCLCADSLMCTELECPPHTAGPKGARVGKPCALGFCEDMSNCPRCSAGLVIPHTS